MAATSGEYRRPFFRKREPFFFLTFLLFFSSFLITAINETILAESISARRIFTGKKTLLF